ncbi:MAG TPA: PorP/SprF family type IX secretion system membrane protein [Chitinophagaceae bacterium]|nr:PorP/SprF family type IX secretion system membrane protein [Chitinophagaceae bacterium]
MNKNQLLKTVTALLLAVIGSGGAIKAQVDPHFSQYFIQPMFLNPALTGAIEGDYRVSAVWRSQYGNTLTTQGISAEAPTSKNLNLGLNLMHQSSSDGAYNYTNGYLNFAYTGVRFGDHQVVMAIQGGLINRRFNVSKLQFGDQWVAGLGYNPSSITSENFYKSSVTAFDAGAGISYYDGTSGKKMNLFGGIAAFHLTRPTDPFISGGEKERLPIRYSVHAGARIFVSDMFDLVPNFLYMRQGNAQEKMIGAYAQLYGGANTDLMFGANLRIDDALAPFVGFYHKGFTVGMSYDVNASSKTAGSISRSSIEVSLSYVGWGGSSEIKTKPFYCPRF